MGKIQVNPSTGKVLVSRDSAGNSKLCSTCCVPEGGYADSDCGCFIDGDGTGCLSNPNFDEWPPFGGPGKTPGVWTIAIDDYLPGPLPDINGVWNLPFVGGGDNCIWTFITTIGGESVNFSLNLCDTSTFPQLNISITGITLFRYDPLNCEIIVDNAPNHFPKVASRGGFVSWRPGQISAWNSGTAYEIDNTAAHEAVFYKCNTAHSNQEPPNASYWDVI